VEIKPDGKAASSGIRQGDLLSEVNHIKIATMDQYLEVLAGIKKGGTVQLLFRRGNTSFIAVRFIKE